MKLDIYNLLGVPPRDFQTTSFITSWCLPTYLLAGIRIFLSVYSFTAIIYSFKWFADHTVIFHLEDIDTKPITFPVGAEGIRQSFSYFTYETFWGLAFYFFFSSLHGFVYARRGYTWLDRWPRYLQAMHSVFYTTITCYPLLVSTVYWGSMWARIWWRDDFSQWNMITMHAMNSVFAMFEILFTNTNPPPIPHLPILLLFMSLYLGIAYITKVTEGLYIYLWLDPKNGVVKLLLHIVGYAALVTAYFFFVRLCIALRLRLTRNRRRYRQVQSPVIIPLASPTSTYFSSSSSIHKANKRHSIRSQSSRCSCVEHSRSSIERAYQLLHEERMQARQSQLLSPAALSNLDISKPRPTLSRPHSATTTPIASPRIDNENSEWPLSPTIHEQTMRISRDYALQTNHEYSQTPEASTAPRASLIRIQNNDPGWPLPAPSRSLRNSGIATSQTAPGSSLHRRNPSHEPWL